MRLKAIDLCGGAGGWAVAARGLPIDIVMAVDWWRPACMTYKLNHPKTLVVRADLKAPCIDTVSLRGQIDLVVGGIPCQWLSKYRDWTEQSSVKASEKVEGRALVDAILDLTRAIAPRYWALEDVVQLLGELPPLTPHQVIDASRYSGQRRKRVYVGEFPAPPRTARDPRVLGDYLLPGPYRVGARLHGRRPALSRTFRKETCLGAYADRKAPTVCNVGSRRDAELGVVDERLPGGLRQMEWQEAALQQGYPTDYLFYGPLTDVQQMIANSIQIDTGRAILEAIVADAEKGRTKEVA